MFEFDSDEERYFSWYLNELKNFGVIAEWSYHPKPFQLSERIVHVYEQQLKTKVISKDSVILNDHQYQADFLIHWNPEWHGKLYSGLNNTKRLSTVIFISNYTSKYFSVIDVKGTFMGPRNNSAVTFPLNQKWVWQKYGIYVQKVIPKILFKESFTPAKYLLTDKSGKARKIDYEIRSISQYIESINNV